MIRVPQVPKTPTQTPQAQGTSRSECVCGVFGIVFDDILHCETSACINHHIPFHDDAPFASACMLWSRSFGLMNMHKSPSHLPSPNPHAWKLEHVMPIDCPTRRGVGRIMLEKEATRCAWLSNFDFDRWRCLGLVLHVPWQIARRRHWPTS
jgi:hypothetical protein